MESRQNLFWVCALSIAPPFPPQSNVFLKSSQTFLAIKRGQQTKFGKVINLTRSSIFKLARLRQ
jgi:hypothetical protein